MAAAAAVMGGSDEREREERDTGREERAVCLALRAQVPDAGGEELEGGHHQSEHVESDSDPCATGLHPHGHVTGVSRVVVHTGIGLRESTPVGESHGDVEGEQDEDEVEVEDRGADDDDDVGLIGK